MRGGGVECDFRLGGPYFLTFVICFINLPFVFLIFFSLPFFILFFDSYSYLLLLPRPPLFYLAN